MTLKIIDLISQYLTEEDKENANKFDSYTKLRGYVADNYIKQWALSNIYTEDIREAHESGFFHIHDLSDGLVPYCKGHDITKILIRGLKTQTVIAGPPKHLSSFFDQCVNLIAYNQQHWAGAMAIAHINTYAAPFIRKDWGHLRDEDENYPDEIYQIVKQAVQSFIFNLNFPSRAGSQTPFSNVILNFKCPEILRDQDVVNAGCEGFYGDYDAEAYLILKAFNDVYNEGDAGGRPFTFPIPTLNLLPDTPFDDPLWHEIVATTVKFGTWSFFNYIGSGLNPNSILAMCCRLFNNYDEINGHLEEVAQAGGRWAYQGETGSIGVVTLNMSKLGHLANKSKPAFYELLEDALDKARRSLILKGIFIEKFKDRFMPFDVEYGTDLRRFFRTIGVVGLNEMCVNLFGTPLSEKKEFVVEVLDYLREWTKETQKATRVLWNVEMTPAEGCATRLAMMDKELYGDDIFTQGIEGAWYYTSMVTPPNQELGLIERILIEQDILLKFSGGTIHRVFLGEQNPSVAGVAKLIERITKHTKVVYFDLASIYSICKKDGKQRRGNHPICEECGSEALVYARIVGYYRPISQANAGKMQEILERHRINL